MNNFNLVVMRHPGFYIGFGYIGYAVTKVAATKRLTTGYGNSSVNF